MPEIDFRAPRLFVDAPLGAGQTVVLERNQSNYLGNVLRLSAGDTILVFNGRDGEWQAQIAGRKRADSLTIGAQTRPQDRLPDIAYVFAPLKHARLDYMVQKAVEMGAARLQPVLTRFTQVSRVNGERMRANVVEAAEQCEIISIAEVADPVPLDRFLGQRQAERLLVFCDEAAEVVDPLQALQKAEGAPRGGRHPDRSRRRIFRGRTRAAAAPAEDHYVSAGAAHPAGGYSGRRSAGAGAGRARRLGRIGLGNSAASR